MQYFSGATERAMREEVSNLNKIRPREDQHCLQVRLWLQICGFMGIIDV